MLIMGQEIGPPVRAHNGTGQCSVICRATTFQIAYLSGTSCALTVPRCGGVYVPDVLVFADSERRPIEPFRMGMVYATAPWFADESSDPKWLEWQAEMRRKFINVLRICRDQGCDELILGAWSCGRGRGRPELVASIFWDALLGKADTANVFKHVVFAIPTNKDPKARKALDAFRQAFSGVCA